LSTRARSCPQNNPRESRAGVGSLDWSGELEDCRANVPMAHTVSTVSGSRNCG
jgi:hypothetical protein